MARREIDDLARDARHPVVPLAVGRLVEVGDRQHPILGCVRQQVVLAVDDADRRVQQERAILTQDRSQPVDERHELVLRNEVLLQDVRLIVQRVSQIRHRVVHRLVA
jgi:hypothetical protein